MASPNNIESAIAMVTFLNELKPSHSDSVSSVVQMLVQWTLRITDTLVHWGVLL